MHGGRWRPWWPKGEVGAWFGGTGGWGWDGWSGGGSSSRSVSGSAVSLKPGTPSTFQGKCAYSLNAVQLARALGTLFLGCMHSIVGRFLSIPRSTKRLLHPAKVFPYLV